MSIEIVDAEAVEDVGTDVVPAQHGTLFHTDDPVEVVQRATQVASALADVIRNQRLYETIQGKAHVKVEGWQLLGGMLGVTAVCTDTQPVDGGWKATVEARTSDGRVVGRADALCTKHEKRGPWKNADDYARLSMAQTRATSKALKGPLGFVISLAGYATTPLEEMTFAAPDEAPPVAKQPTARPAKQTKRPATAKQRRLIMAKAAEANLDPADLANRILAGTGNDPRDWQDDDAAKSFVDRSLDRLPAESVDAVLEAVTA